MHCSQCGAILADEANYCSNCGDPLPVNTAKQSNDLPAPSMARKPTALWVVIVGVLLFFAYAALFILAIARKSPNPQSGWGFVFWTGLFFYLWWWRDNRNARYGALIGAVVGFLLFGIAAFVSGYTSRAYERNQQAIQAVKGMQQDINRAFGDPSVASPQTVQVATESGEIGEVQKWIRTLLTRIDSLNKDYLQELQNIGWSVVTH